MKKILGMLTFTAVMAAVAAVGAPKCGIAELTAALNRENAVVVDARINDVYIGWPVDGNRRGGHIPGAVDFSAAWLTCEYDEENNLEKRSRAEVLDIALSDKGITAGMDVIVYDTNGKDAAAVADFFEKKGIANVRICDVSEYVNGEGALESYPDYELLVAPEIVHDIVNGNIPGGFSEASDIKVFNISWGDVKASGYSKSHIPGAYHVNTDWFEPPTSDNGHTMWMLDSDENLLALLLRLGITADDCVICTGPEPMASSRFAVICRYMGVKDVRVMNGGLVEWKYLGYGFEKGVNEPVPVAGFGIASVPANPTLIDTFEEIYDILSDGKNLEKFSLIDNRTWEEYIGESTGYSYHDKKGRIPGTIFGHAGVQNSSSMSYFRNIDKTIRNIGEIRDMWISDGINLDKHLSFMCGSGWRAAEILWDARVMGLENTSLYSNGWIYWSNLHMPCYTGTPKR